MSEKELVERARRTTVSLRQRFVTFHGANDCAPDALCQTAASVIDGLLAILPAIEAATQVKISLRGHEEPCFFCNEPCDALAANPGRWPVGFPHCEGTGVGRWHHSVCLAKFIRDHSASVAQGIEQGTSNAEVAGSNPAGRAIEAAALERAAQLLELLDWKHAAIAIRKLIPKPEGGS